MRQRLREWGARAVLVCVSVFFTLTMFEIGLRLFFPQFGGCEFGMKDEQLGWKLIPNYSDVCYGYGAIASVQISSQSFRNPQVQIPKPANVFRILVLGDSTTFGIGVDATETVPAILEAQLNQNTPRSMQYEVVNAGVPGYGTAQEWLLYKRWRQELDPDLIILIFLVTNDIQDNMCLENRGSRPCFQLRQTELELTTRQVLANSAPLNSPEVARTLNKLHTYIFFREHVRNLVTGNVTVVRLLTRMGFQPDSDTLPPILHAWYDTTYATDGWRLTEALLDAMLSDTQQDDIPLLLVILPGQSQTTQNYADLVDALYGNTLEGTAFHENPTQPQETLLKWAKERNVLAIDMLEPLKKVALSSRINLADGHFNGLGNQVIAEEIHTFLKQADFSQDWNVEQ